jgi:aspartate aminotransferase
LGQTYAGRRVDTAHDLSMYLLEGAGVSTVPGEAFGLKGFIRLSFACSTEQIEAGCTRIAEALKGS